MSLSIKEVEKIAQLARLNLTEAEKKRHSETISEVLDYMKILEEVDVSDVEITSQVTGLEDVVREDKIEECETVEELKQIFPDKDKDSLKVPKVL